MNVYDFDKTIYAGDSTLDFYLFCLIKKPKIILCLPQQLLGLAFFILDLYDKNQFKESFYSFLKKLDNTPDLVDEFWQKNQHKIRSWYSSQQKTDDLLISASPEFLLLPICHKLKINHLIASQVDSRTGQSTGPNCYGAEKVNRLGQVFPQHTIDNFYSDSLSDAPLAELAKKSYLVQGDKLIPWGEYQPSRRQRIWSMFFSRSFVLFILVGLVNTFNGVIFAYLYSLLTYTNLAFILGYLTSLTISYLLNSRITFKAELSLSKYLKFCIAYIPNFLAQNAMVLLCYNILGWPKLIAFVLAAMLGVPITFALMKLYAFKL